MVAGVGMDGDGHGNKRKINGHANGNGDSTGNRIWHSEIECSHSGNADRPKIRVNSPDVVYHMKSDNGSINCIESTYSYDSSSVRSGADGEYIITPKREAYKLLTDVRGKPAR